DHQGGRVRDPAPGHQLYDILVQRVGRQRVLQACVSVEHVGEVEHEVPTALDGRGELQLVGRLREPLSPATIADQVLLDGLRLEVVGGPAKDVAAILERIDRLVIEDPTPGAEDARADDLSNLDAVAVVENVRNLGLRIPYRRHAVREVHVELPQLRAVQ